MQRIAMRVGSKNVIYLDTPNTKHFYQSEQLLRGIIEGYDHIRSK